MPLTLCECASHRFRQKPQNWISLINVTFKSISVLKPWLVYMNSFAITPLHVLIFCSKNCSLTSLLGFLHTSSIRSLMTILITNLFFQSIHLFLHFILTTQPNFLECFHIFFIFYASPKFLPQGQAQDDTKRLPALNDRRPAPALGRLFNLPETPALRQEFHPLPPLSCGPLLYLKEELTALEKSLAVPAG